MELKKKVKNGLAIHTVSLIKEKNEKGLYNDPYLQRMISQWEHKINHPENLLMSDEAKQNYLELLENQRKYLAGLNKDAELDEEMIRWQIYQIDLEEERVRLL